MDLSTLAKALASDQLKIRKRAQYEIENRLRREPKDESALPTYSEMLVICKGLHYTLWMQDKLLLKEEIVNRICGMLPLIPHPQSRVLYINAMYETLAREWDLLDNWRVDKFLLLTRDFFTQALHSLVTVDRQVFGQLLDAVFEKVLNTDIQHAIGLKMHMCTVLSEELSKKKIKSFCVAQTLVHLISRLAGLPKHHTYSHTILRTIHTLLGTLRRHANPNAKPLVEKLAQLTAQRGPHFKSLRRISAIISAIVAKAEKRKALKEQAKTEETSQEPEATESEPVPGSLTDDTATPKTKKRKRVLKEEKLAHKKRRLTEDSAESITDISVNVQTSNAPDEQTKADDLTESCAGADIEDEQLGGSDTQVSQSVKPTISSEKTPETPRATIQPTLGTTPIDSVDRAKRRVSFGKVFRKRFVPSQRLSMTPTAKINPKKGILREQTPTGGRPRLSI